MGNILNKNKNLSSRKIAGDDEPCWEKFWKLANITSSKYWKTVKKLYKIRSRRRNRKRVSSSDATEDGPVVNRTGNRIPKSKSDNWAECSKKPGLRQLFWSRGRIPNSKGQLQNRSHDKLDINGNPIIPTPSTLMKIDKLIDANNNPIEPADVIVYGGQVSKPKPNANASRSRTNVTGASSRHQSAKTRTTASTRNTRTRSPPQQRSHMTRKRSPVIKRICGHPIAPPAYLDYGPATCCGSGSGGRIRGKGPIIDRLKNVDVIEELQYQVPDCCDDNYEYYYQCNDCGEMEICCDPPQTTKPVTYSRRQRFNFDDGKNDEEFKAPYSMACPCICCAAGIRRDPCCMCRCCMVKGRDRIANSFDETPVGKNPEPIRPKTGAGDSKARKAESKKPSTESSNGSDKSSAAGDEDEDDEEDQLLEGSGSGSASESGSGDNDNNNKIVNTVFVQQRCPLEQEECCPAPSYEDILLPKNSGVYFYDAVRKKFIRQQPRTPTPIEVELPQLEVPPSSSSSSNSEAMRESYCPPWPDMTEVLAQIPPQPRGPKHVVAPQPLVMAPVYNMGTDMNAIAANLEASLLGKPLPNPNGFANPINANANYPFIKLKPQTATQTNRPTVSSSTSTSNYDYTKPTNTTTTTGTGSGTSSGSSASSTSN